jgi:hypothetical protein
MTFRTVAALSERAGFRFQKATHQWVCADLNLCAGAGLPMY